MLNYEVFRTDPRDAYLPNMGVAEVRNPTNDSDWKTVEFELSNFVCSGAYGDGLAKILGGYLEYHSREACPAAWVSGFFGSGKSHLVRVLEFLWRDEKMPSGASARSIARVTDEIVEMLVVLSRLGRASGGLWSTGADLRSYGTEDVRLAIVKVFLSGTGLPTDLPQARFAIWLKQEGLYDKVAEELRASGHDFDGQLRRMYISPSLAGALTKHCPTFPALSEVGSRLKSQFPPQAGQIDGPEMLALIRDALSLVSTKPGKLPCALVVLDEVQQYVQGDANRASDLDNVIKSISTHFESQVLIVATGQSALQNSPALEKLKDRFAIHVALSDSEVETVVREVVLRKAEDKVQDIDAALAKCSGEIDRQLSGTKIETRTDDRSVLCADYPLLPVRRRFWEAVLRAIDTSGAAQLRTQLRVTLEAARAVRDRPLGTVVPADIIYDQQAKGMEQSNILSREVSRKIDEMRAQGPSGALAARLCATVFLINRINKDSKQLGIMANADTLADLLVEDLVAGSAELRRAVPDALARLVDSGDLMLTGNEYAVQTAVGKEWENDYKNRLQRIVADQSRVPTDRKSELQQTVTKAIGSWSYLQGKSLVGRKHRVFFGETEPALNGGIDVPIWIRTGWETTEKALLDHARQAGTDSPIVFVFLPKDSSGDLDAAIARRAAAVETLSAKGQQTAIEAIEAKRAIESKEEGARRDIDDLLRRIMDGATVIQGGGAQIAGATLKAAVESAAAASLARMFPRFDDADAPIKAWEKTVSRAKQGNAGALSELGYTGEPTQHPALSRILQYIGPRSIKGGDIRTQFRGIPYGWPQDAIDGCLWVGAVAGHLQTRRNGTAVAPTSIEQTALGQIEFRAETRTVGAQQRLDVRSLIAALDRQCKEGEEAAVLPGIVVDLKALAQSCGGKPPLPEPPAPAYLADLEQLTGNDLVLAVWEHRQPIRSDYDAWSPLARKAKDRANRWATCGALLAKAGELEDYARFTAERDAIVSNRSLLADPDPTAALSQDLARAIRGAIQRARDTHITAYEARIEALEHDSIWARLSQSQKENVRATANLTAVSKPNLGTDDELLAELSAHPLSSWRLRTEALQAQVGAAIHAAAKILEPTAVSVPIEAKTLTTAEEAKAYIADLEQRIMSEIAAGHPVVIRV